MYKATVEYRSPILLRICSLKKGLCIAYITTTLVIESLSAISLALSQKSYLNDCNFIRIVSLITPLRELFLLFAGFFFFLSKTK